MRRTGKESDCTQRTVSVEMDSGVREGQKEKKREKDKKGRVHVCGFAECQSA